MHAIVTGAGGFVGAALRAAALGPVHALSLGSEDWERALAAAPLEGATIFHLAARVHDPRDRDEAAFRRDNTHKTRRLAEEAVRRRARRVVFLSTIKVHGEETSERPFRVDDAPAPQDAYARSKLEAEEALREVAGAGGVSWVAVRSPLVLGPGARANLASLMRIADSAWPLPFAAIANRRSYVHRDDLARLLLACAANERAADRVFIAAHPVPVSTTALVLALRHALGRSERLWPAPPRLLEIAATIAGQRDRMRRLTRSLEADPSLAMADLGWEPRVGLAQAAAEMAQAWREGVR